MPWRYCIRFQWRRPGGCRPGANPRDWRSWREFSSWPMTFATAGEAQAHLDSIPNPFFNLKGKRKASVSVCSVYIKP